jgi:tetratricopeptide (TPR) repeat protein
MMKYILFYLLIGSIYPFHTVFAQQSSKVLNEQSRNQIIMKIGKLLVDNYVETETALACNRFLTEKAEDDGYDELTHPREFAKQLNKDLRKIHNDRHIRIQFISPEGRDFEINNPKLFFLLRTQERFKENMGIREIKILSGNVGYLDLHSFEPLDLAREKLLNTLRLLQDVDALIIDLRNNNGGNPATVQFLCSWFFDQSLHLNSIYWRYSDYTEEFWTIEDIGIKKRPILPLFILTGSKTFSAAEEFAYNMKVQKRAILIGTKTAGGANPGYTFSISDQFNIFIPTGRSVNPITGTNWEGVGVTPDISTKSSNALNIANEKAMQKGRIYREEQDDLVIAGYMKLRDNLNNADLLFTRGERDSANALVKQSLSDQIESGNMNEWTINALGYQYINEKRESLSLALFKFNVDHYPESANAWDSLGEGYYLIGNWELGIKAYEKSLFLNPRNQNAQMMLDKSNKHIDNRKGEK